MHSSTLSKSTLIAMMLADDKHAISAVEQPGAYMGNFPLASIHPHTCGKPDVLDDALRSVREQPIVIIETIICRRWGKCFGALYKGGLSPFGSKLA